MKRIVICSDGTWASPETDEPTSVLRLSRAVAPVDPTGREQVVFYDWGVGSDRQKLLGGVSGVGIDKNIQDCYRFIVHNYEPGDELFFFGFSRGAYTVRSLGGFIRNCGIIRRPHAERIPEAYDLYRKRSKNSAPDADRAVEFRRQYAVADISRIRFVGVFDTVGSLGVPITFWGLLDNAEYLFHDTSPSKIIDCARHAVSIDENREDFLPTLWDRKPGLDLQQVWFSGVHSDIGGGYPQRGLADLPFQWMISEATAMGLAVERHAPDALAPDPRGKLHDERKGIYRFRGKVVRELPTDALVHRSVRERFETEDRYGRNPGLRSLLDHHHGDWNRIQLV